MGIGNTPAGKLDVGSTSSSFTDSIIRSSITGISELRFADTRINSGYVAYDNSGDSMRFGTDATERMRIDSSGNVLVGTTTATSGTLLTVNSGIADSIGNVRTVPENTKTAAYVLVAADNGKYINITTGGVTVNSGIFTTGQSVTVYNNSASSQTITQGTSVTMYLVGTATTGNRTLAQRGLCTIFCVASNTFVITGGGLT